jgi:ubiquinone/menaquinone biosynthesis C-methylase UbiE
VVTPIFLERLTGTAVLDVGGGGGTVAARLSRASGCSVVVLDPSPAQIRRAERVHRRQPRVTARLGAAGEIPFADQSFDYVVTSCAWKHWPNPSKGVSECLRVLRPGGRFVILEIDGTSSPSEFWDFAKTSRVPVGMKRAYVRFAMRTVVGVAPDIGDVRTSFGDHHVSVERLDGAPFCWRRQPPPDHG